MRVSFTSSYRPTVKSTNDEQAEIRDEENFQLLFSDDVIGVLFTSYSHPFVTSTKVTRNKDRHSSARRSVLEQDGSDVGALVRIWMDIQARTCGHKTMCTLQSSSKAVMATLLTSDCLRTTVIRLPSTKHSPKANRLCINRTLANNLSSVARVQHQTIHDHHVILCVWLHKQPRTSHHSTSLKFTHHLLRCSKTCWLLTTRKKSYKIGNVTPTPT